MTQIVTKNGRGEALLAVEPSLASSPRPAKPAEAPRERGRDQWPPDGWPRDGWPPPEPLPEEYWNSALWETT